MAINAACLKHWEARVAQYPLSNICFMSIDQLQPIATRCIDHILRIIPNFPPRYINNYQRVRNEKHKVLSLAVIFFSLVYLPETRPFEVSPRLLALLEEETEDMMKGVYTTVQSYVESVTSMAIMYSI